MQIIHERWIFCCWAKTIYASPTRQISRKIWKPVLAHPIPPTNLWHDTITYIAMPNIVHTSQYILLSAFFVSKVYNESCFKWNQRVSRLFLRICIINHAQLYKSSHTQLYKSSHAVFSDLVSTCRLVVLNHLKTRQSTYKFSMIYGPV